MIVVGILMPGAATAAGVLEIARRAAATGARTEIVGTAPAGPVGDRQLVELAAAGVGHATVTRSGVPGADPGPEIGDEPSTVGVSSGPGSGIEPADLELALRYLPDIRAIVLVEPGAALLATASAASAWSGATLIVVGSLGPEAIAIVDAAAPAPAAAPPIVIEPPARDPDAAFAGLVATLAVRLDAGENPSTAWQATMAAHAVEPA